MKLVVQRSQFADSGAARCTHANGPDFTTRVSLDSVSKSGEIDLVVDDDLGNSVCANVREHLVDMRNLRIANRARSVDDMQ